MFNSSDLGSEGVGQLANPEVEMRMGYISFFDLDIPEHPQE
jgi:hypothetical protein